MKLRVPEALHLGFLEEVVIAHLSGWSIKAGDVRRMIERSRLPTPTGKGHVTFSDCTERICRYKAYQTVMSLDQLIGVWTPRERQEHLDAILGKIERKALFGHVRDYGLVPADLWERSRCDYFCSVKHWTVLVTLNHLLHADRTPHSTPTEATQERKDQ